MTPETPAPWPVCVFLVPILRDSDRKHHAMILWGLLRRRLIETFGAFTGPETLLYYRTRLPVAGTWSPSPWEDPVEDKCRRYTVAIPSDGVSELRAFLRRAGNAFDQRVIYLEVAGYAEFLEVDPRDGSLGFRPASED